MLSSQVSWYLRQILGIHFYPGILVFTLETLAVHTNVYVDVSDIKNSVQDVFTVISFNLYIVHLKICWLYMTFSCICQVWYKMFLPFLILETLWLEKMESVTFKNQHQSIPFIIRGRYEIKTGFKQMHDTGSRPFKA